MSRPNLNLVVLIGNLTRDPQLRYTASGQPVADFSVAVNRIYRNQENGEKKEEVSFIPVVVWGKQAENCSQYLAKGRAVCIQGYLQSRSWESNQGEKRNRLEVIAQRVQFLGGPSKLQAETAETKEEILEIEKEIPEDDEEIPF